MKLGVLAEFTFTFLFEKPKIFLKDTLFPISFLKSAKKLLFFMKFRHTFKEKNLISLKKI